MITRPPTVFLDFDGTITTRDVTDAILDAYADPQWLVIEEEWKAGRIGSRECLAAQMALVSAGTEQIDAVLDAIEVDPGFAHLLEWGLARRVPIHIVSDGFDYCIQRILSRSRLGLTRYLSGVQIVSSRLAPASGRWRASFTASCAHGCATCKPAAMDRLKAPGSPAIFVGDGLSDCYAAGVADVVFAKDALAVWCREHSIAHLAFDTLDTVAAAVDSLVTSDTGRLTISTGKAFPAT
jgi:2,3-diketo-5-methylthio-1-phosphopentane phosphatase